MSPFSSMISRLAIGVVALLVASVVLEGCGGQPGERAYRDGLAEMKRENYARGRVLLENSMTERPADEKNAMAYNYLGVASMHLGQLDRAIDEFEESMRLNPQLFAPKYNLAVLMHEGGNTERARALLEEAISIQQTDARAVEYLARIQLDSGDHAKARAILEDVLEREPGSPWALTTLAVLVRAGEGADPAVAYLMRALEKDPDYAPALYNLGLLYERELNDPDRAVSFYARYLDVAPAGVHRDYALRAHEGLAPAGKEAAEPEPLVAPEREEGSDAEPDQRPAVRPFDELLTEARATAQAGRSREALELVLEAARTAGQLKDAKNQEWALRTAVSLCSEEPEAHYAWGSYCLERARYEPALQAFKRASALNPKWIEARLGLAEAAMETGEFDAALITLKQAVRLDERNADALWALATLYDEYLAMAPPATETYRAFARRFPGDPRIVRAQDRLKILEPPPPPPKQPEPETAAREPETPPPAADVRTEEKTPPAETASPPARLEIKTPLVKNTKAAIQAYNRGIEYQEGKDWDHAIYYYTRAIENDNAFVNAYYNLGAVYRITDELALSKEAYLHAVQLQPKMTAARYNLALVYIDLGSTSAAVEQLRTVLKQEPRHAPSHYALGLLYARNQQARDLARQHYQRFLELAPNDPAVPTVRAWLQSNR